MDEMAEFEKYNKMTLTSFLEFIGRCADQLYIEHIPFTQKLERTLGFFFPLVKMEFRRPDTSDANIDSESDEDDDYIEKVSMKVLEGIKQK